MAYTATLRQRWQEWFQKSSGFNHDDIIFFLRTEVVLHHVQGITDVYLGRGYGRNDGFAVVVFIVLLGIAGAGHGDEAVSVSSVLILFLQEAVGGVGFGLIAGYVVFRMLASIDNYQVEILLTLGLVFGGYALASAIHLSGPIFVVVPVC